MHEIVCVASTAFNEYLQGDSKKHLTQTEINIKDTSDKNIEIKNVYTDRKCCFLSITKTIM